MFVPARLFDRFMEMQALLLATNKRVVEESLQRVLDAKDTEVGAIVAAKEDQIRALHLTINNLRAQVEHERHRAEAAIDILLTKNGEAGPIRNADLIRESAEREAKEPKGKSPNNAMGQFLKAISGVGEDIDDGPTIQPDEKFVVGGVS